MDSEMYKPARGLQCRESGTTWKITDAQGVTFRLSGTGYWIWKMVSEHDLTVDEIEFDCLSHWAGDKQRVATDVRAFLAQLLRDGLIVRVSRAGP